MLTFLSSDGTGIWSRGGKVRVTTAGRRLYVWLELAGRPASGLMIPMEASWKRADKNLHRLPGRDVGVGVPFPRPQKPIASEFKQVHWLAEKGYEWNRSPCVSAQSIWKMERAEETTHLQTGDELWLYKNSKSDAARWRWSDGWNQVKSAPGTLPRWSLWYAFVWNILLR